MKSLTEFKTTEREKNDGTVTCKVNLGKIPEELHLTVVDMSCPGNTVCDIYSNAIDDLMADYKSGVDIKLISAPRNGRKTQIWLHERSNSNMRDLANKLIIDHTSVVYVAITRFLDKERNRMH